jgi:aryl-alcohol dehydrogenase-like predicted oxidoreductase
MSIRAALAAGVGWVDTAPFYGWGRAERAVGQALNGMTAGWPALLTKCGTLRGPDGRSYEDHRAATIRADLDASLARLGCSSVDVLQLHDPDPRTPVETAWETVHELIAEGRVRGGGLSNHPVALMERARKVGPVDVVQHQFSLLHRVPERTGVLAWCADNDAEFLAWSPLASGFLADGFDIAALSPGDFRRTLPWSGGVLGERLGELRRALAGIAAGTGLSMSALAIGWVLAKGAKAIVGARSPGEAAAIAGYRPLASDVAAAVDAAARAFDQ